MQMPMRIQRLNNIKWFLEDSALIDALKGLVSREDARRGYFNLDYQDKKAFVKFFAERGISGSIRHIISPRGRKEYRLGKRLLEMSVPTPKPLGYGLSDIGSYVIQQWIEGDAFVDLFFEGKNRPELLNNLADFLNLLKAQKVLHNDLHLYNVIVCKDMLYLIDLHKMALKRHFNLKDEVSNLSHAITMLYDDMTEAEKELFFNRYGVKDIRTHVENEMSRLWERWIRKKQGRAFDNTSQMAVKGDCVYMTGRETLADEGPVELIKKDKKTIVERHSNHIRKIYRNKRRLKKAWENHVALKYLNLSVTPEPYCVKRPSLFSTGYIAMEDLGVSGEELDRHLDRTYDRMDKKERKTFIAGLSSFFSVLFKKKIAHRDLKGCNIFVLNNGGFLLLDVEDIIFTHMNEERLKQMLTQLNTTIPKRISVKDRMRFYLKAAKDLKIDKKQVFKDVLRESLKSEIVYEGVGGLKREYW